MIRETAKIKNYVLSVCVFKDKIVFLIRVMQFWIVCAHLQYNPYHNSVPLCRLQNTVNNLTTTRIFEISQLYFFSPRPRLIRPLHFFLLFFLVV